MRKHVMWTDESCNLRVTSFKTESQRKKFLGEIAQLKLENHDIYLDMVFDGEIKKIDPTIMRGVPHEHDRDNREGD